MQRRQLLLLFGAAPFGVFAQSGRNAVELKSIRVGSFEFPLEGRYEVERQGGATIFNLVDGNRTITVGVLRKPTGGPSLRSELINEAEILLMRNWVKFAEAESGVVRSPFSRSNLRDDLALMSMSTEFGAAERTQFYLNFAATDGLEIASLVIEGPGSAADAERELLPVVRGVTYAPRSN